MCETICCACVWPGHLHVNSAQPGRGRVIRETFLRSERGRRVAILGKLSSRGL